MDVVDQRGKVQLLRSEQPYKAEIEKRQENNAQRELHRTDDCRQLNTIDGFINELIVKTNSIQFEHRISPA